MIRVSERKDKLEQLAKLKQGALAELERRGYEVRGKTPVSTQLANQPKIINSSDTQNSSSLMTRPL